MALTVTFNGASIRKPGSYSKTKIDLGGNLPLSPVGLIGMIGEGFKGLAGSKEKIQDNVFSAARLSALRDKYGAGSPIADAAELAFSPSNDGQIVNGANNIYVYKTNESVASTKALPSGYGVLSNNEAGGVGNLTSIEISDATFESLPAVPRLMFIPSSVATGATEYKFSVNGSAVVSPSIVPAYTGAAGDPVAFAAALTALPGIVATVPGKEALFDGLTDASSLIVSSASDGSSIFTLGVAGTVAAQVDIGEMFVIGGLTLGGSTWNGVYLATAPSTTSTLVGVKVRNLANSGITKPAAATYVPDTEALDLEEMGFVFGSFDLSVDVPQAQGQGASLQMAMSALGHSRLFGGSPVSILPASAADVASLSVSVVDANTLSVALSVGNWSVRPAIGSSVWILQDSQLAGALLENCGSFVVHASSYNSLTLKRLGASGAFSPVSAVLVSVAHLENNLRCFSAHAHVDEVVSVLVTSEAESTKIITLRNDESEREEQSDELGGVVVMSVGFSDSACTAATLAISKADQTLKTTITGLSDKNLALDLSQYKNLGQVANFINTIPGYTAFVPAIHINKTVDFLDDVSALGIFSIPTVGIGASAAGRVKADVKAVVDMFAQSDLVSADIKAVRGLPSVMDKSYLTGGSVGGTQASAIIAALDEFQKVRINSVVPLFSRDAALDIAEGLTDKSSTYMIDAIHSAVKSHCMLMSNTINRSERHCVLAFRGDYSVCKEKAASLSNARAQLFIQDVLVTGSDGVIGWQQPHILAAIHAGMRAGAEVGLPLTFKYYNVSGIRQTASNLKAAPKDIVIGFEPRTMYADAIDSGISFIEVPSQGGFRLVVDNTTYRKDDNWVMNRGATLHAADVVVFDFRQRMEDAVVGQKNTVWTATSVRGFAENLLINYAAQGLLGRTADAPNGFKNLSVSLSGNQVNINATIILVEGIDFVLSEFTLTRNVATA
jgi:hypothetical protein